VKPEFDENFAQILFSLLPLPLFFPILHLQVLTDFEPSEETSKVTDSALLCVGLMQNTPLLAEKLKDCLGIQKIAQPCPPNPNSTF